MDTRPTKYKAKNFRKREPLSQHYPTLQCLLSQIHDIMIGNKIVKVYKSINKQKYNYIHPSVVGIAGKN